MAWIDQGTSFKLTGYDLALHRDLELEDLTVCQIAGPDGQCLGAGQRPVGPNVRAWMDAPKCSRCQGNGGFTGGTEECPDCGGSGLAMSPAEPKEEE